VSKEKKQEEAAPKKSVAARFRLASGNQGMFRRSVRDEAGNILHTMEFPRDAVVEVDADGLKALIDDIRTEPNKGAVLEVDEKGKPLDKPSSAVADAMKAKADAIAKSKAERQAKHKAAMEGEPLNPDGTTPKKVK
jgi:hypothetical protein